MAEASSVDPRPTFFAAAAQLAGLVSVIGPADLARPTPCDDYDVEALAGHVLCVFRRITHIARGGAFDDVPQVITGVAPDKWPEVVAADHAALVATWSDDSVLERILTLPPGIQAPGRVGALRYSQEMLTHAWDLAAALGRTGDLDPALAEPFVASARQLVPRDRDGWPFSPVVDVPETAGPYERLVGWLGRDPGWTPPPSGHLQ